MSQTMISQELLDFLKSLVSESRIKILLLFLDGRERTVNQIAEEVELGQPTTSEHLSVMKRSGVLVSKKQSKEVYYHPDRAQIVHYLEALSELLHNFCKP